MQCAKIPFQQIKREDDEIMREEEDNKLYFFCLIIQFQKFSEIHKKTKQIINLKLQF